MYSSLPHSDLAGQVYPHLKISHMRKRLKNLINKYLTQEILTSHLEDLPIQIKNPQPRPWGAIHWDTINSEQVIGIELELFLSIIVGAIDTETPIRGYTHTSRQYLEPVHREFARFVGGVMNLDGTISELGLWEKEERQHAPALIKIYKQLTGNQPSLSPHIPRNYRPSGNPQYDLYRHGLHRVITEYSAVCLYLWLMVHTTGTLQQVLGELLQDEINHMIKFWGFGLWLFPETCLSWLKPILTQKPTPVSHKVNFSQTHSPSTDVEPSNHIIKTFSRMMGVLNWHRWSWTHKLELSYTFMSVSHRLWCWKETLTKEYLQQLFGKD